MSFSSFWPCKSCKIFHDDKFDTCYREIMLVAGFLIKAAFCLLDVYYKKINGPILGKAQRLEFALFKNIS